MPKIILVDELSVSDINWRNDLRRKVNEVIHVYNVWQYEDNFDLVKGKYVLARVEQVERLCEGQADFSQVAEMKNRLIELGVRNDD